ncbi:MAG: hypothetical protein K0Q71_886 [Thermomicrobiales bacterium]|jgi:hypothetical protein|nr:hypothetical protein [Thermomicrobiales bacterium]MDF3038180.1 hypothetical protein [Thermomicrobiales bacterium]
MSRVVVALLFAIAVALAAVGAIAPRSLALEEGPTPSPTPPPEVCDASETDGWDDRVYVEPYGEADALVRPLDSEFQDLYLVVWDIRAGTCVPYAAEGNQKDGAIVLIVRDGVVEFTAEPYFEESEAFATWGRTHGDSQDVEFGTTVTLYPGDWVTMNDQMWFTLRAIGGESAEVLKAVWAKPPIDIGGAGGTRK